MAIKVDPVTALVMETEFLLDSLKRGLRPETVAEWEEDINSIRERIKEVKASYPSLRRSGS